MNTPTSRSLAVSFCMPNYFTRENIFACKNRKLGGFYVVFSGTPLDRLIRAQVEVAGLTPHVLGVKGSYIQGSFTIDQTWMRAHNWLLSF